MALADFTSLKAKMAAPSQHFDTGKAVVTVNPGLGSDGYSMFRSPGTPGAGAIPGASAACDNTLAGSFGQVNPSAGELRLWVRRLCGGFIAAAGGMGGVQIVDRLVHMGGLDGTLTTAQAVSTAALTRSTSGAGVFAGIEIYTQLGVTATTATISYTNQAGVAGQTSQPTEIGAGGRIGGSKLLPLSLAAGDTGVQAVSTLTLALSTGTAGNFGVTLYRPITPIIPIFPGLAASGDPVLDWGGYAALVDNGACLHAIFHGSINGTFNNVMAVEMFED